MTPRQQAEAYYRTHAPEDPDLLVREMRMHWSRGVLVDTPELFLMARPVSLEAPIAAVTDPRVPFDPFHCNCWHIHFLAGTMASAFDFAPYPLPFVSMERHRNCRSRVVILQYRELRRLVTCAKLELSHRYTISAPGTARRTSFLKAFP